MDNMYNIIDEQQIPIDIRQESTKTSIINTARIALKVKGKQSIQNWMT